MVVTEKFLVSLVFIFGKKEQLLKNAFPCFALFQSACI